MFTMIRTLYTSELQAKSLQIPTKCSYSVTESSGLSLIKEDVSPMTRDPPADGEESSLSDRTEGSNCSKVQSVRQTEQSMAQVWSKEHRNEERIRDVTDDVDGDSKGLAKGV